MDKRTAKVDFLVHSDGLLRDYISSVVIDSIRKDLGNNRFERVNKNHVQCALILKRLAPCSLKRFAETMHLSKSSASALVDRMVEAGIIRREINPDNRREVLLELTPDFDAHTRLVHARLQQWFAGLIEEIGEDAFEKWFEVMTRVSDVLTKRLQHNGKSHE